MSILSKRPIGPLDSDTSDYTIDQSSVRYRLNLRVGSASEDGGNVGYLENIKGNTQIPFALPVGSNKCIGDLVDEVNNKVYLFIWNSASTHGIYQFDYITNSVVKVIQNLTDTGSVDVLKFDINHRINHANIIDGREFVSGVNQMLLLYWTDGLNFPRKINVNKAINGGYGVINENDINNYAMAPTEPIWAAYTKDYDLLNQNNTYSDLVNKLFEFKYRWIYDDNETSCYSPISKAIIGDKFSSINLSIPTGSKNVIRIELVVRYNIKDSESGVWTDFMLLKDFVKSTLSIQNDSYTQFIFTTLKNLIFIDQNESSLIYDNIPLLAETQEIVNGNVLVYGNITDGYDNPIINVTSNSALKEVIPAKSVNSNVMSILPIKNVGGVITYRVYIWAYNGGATYKIYLNNHLTYIEEQYQYAASFIENATSIRNFFMVIMGGYNPLSTNTITKSFDFDLTTKSISKFSAGLVSGLEPQFEDVIYNYRCFNIRSVNQLGLVYYDEQGRFGSVCTNDNTMVFTSDTYIPINNGSVTHDLNIPIYKLEVKHQPPDWAYSYQVVRTDDISRSYSNYYIAEITAFDKVKITLLNDQVDKGNISSTYGFVIGDKIRALNSINNNGNQGIAFPSFQKSITIKSYDATSGILTLDGLLDVSTGVVVIELFRSNNNIDKVYYEFGEKYLIGNPTLSNRFHYGKEEDQDPSNPISQPALISVTDGPEFVRIKQMTVPSPSSYHFPITFSTDAFDLVYAKNRQTGRNNVVDSTYRRINRPTTIVFSQTFVPNSNINGFSRFFFEDFKEYHLDKGDIKKIALRENYLICYQQLKTGNIPISRSIIEDLSQAGQVGISQAILGEITYYQYDDCGIGDSASSFARIGNNFYHVNPNIGKVFRLSAGGMDDISGVYKMNSYFSKKLKSYIGVDKIIGYVDTDKFDYLITFEDSGSEFEETIGFTDNNLIKSFTSFWSFIPDDGFSAGNNLFTLENGSLWKHETNEDRNTFYGVPYNSEITPIWNDSALQMKTYISLMLQSNGEWSVPEVNTELNQESELTVQNFYVEDLGGGNIITNKEGIRSASFLRATNSSGGLIEGDVLKGVWMKCKLVNNSTDKIFLFTTDIKAVPSYQGIK